MLLWAVVVGEPGLGKSRMIGELIARARSAHPGLLVLSGVADENAPWNPPGVVAWRKPVEDAVLGRAGAGGRPVLVRPKPRPPSLQPQRDAELRKPMCKIRRPIQRIDVPAKLLLHPLPRALFPVYPVVWKHLA